MAFTYDPALSTDRDKVRTHLGDTNSDDPLLQDETIDAVLLSVGGSVYKAASVLANSLAATFGRKADVEIEGLSISYGDRARHFMHLAVRLNGLAGNASGEFAAPLVTGVKVSEVEAARDDTSRLQPVFRAGETIH